MKRLSLVALLVAAAFAAFLPPLLSQQASVVGPGGIPAIAHHSRRDAGTYHRQSISAVDKLSVPGTLTVTAVTEAGSVLTNVARNVAVAAFNRWGNTTVATGAVTPTANQAVRVAFAAVTGADGYDIFLSTAANPLWVGRITEAQRATGTIISTVGTPTAGGAANSVDVGIDGTGVASNAAPFLNNNALTPASVTALDCTGFTSLQIFFKLTVDDLRVLPTLGIVVLIQPALAPNDWFMIQSFAPAFGGSIAPMSQTITESFATNNTISGSSKVVVLVYILTGTNAKADIWVERIN